MLEFQECDQTQPPPILNQQNPRPNLYKTATQKYG